MAKEERVHWLIPLAGKLYSIQPSTVSRTFETGHDHTAINISSHSCEKKWRYIPFPGSGVPPDPI